MGMRASVVEHLSPEPQVPGSLNRSDRIARNPPPNSVDLVTPYSLASWCVVRETPTTLNSANMPCP